MKNFYYILSLLLFIFLLQSCKKEPVSSEPSGPNCDKFNQAMPDASTSGANTFGCKINGELWVAYTDGFSSLIGGSKRLNNIYSEQHNYAFITANKAVYKLNCDTIDQTFLLHINDAAVGENQFAHNGKYYDWEAACVYELDSSAYNKINITELDTENNILSCTFEFRAISEECQDTIYVTEGRMDTKYGF